MKDGVNYIFQGKMSMTGSLMGYENNNDVNQAKCKKPLKPLPVVSSISSTGVTTSATKSKKARKPTRKESCVGGHVNSLWSVWYGILAVAFQAYIAMRYAKRFAGKITATLFYFVKRLSSGSIIRKFFCIGLVVSLSNKISSYFHA